MRTDKRVVLLFVFASLGVACGDDSGGTTDVGGDVHGDTGADVGADVGSDVSTVTYSTCLKGCSTADDCCMTAAAACGDYPNRWTCDTACMLGSCTGNDECVTWATGLGLPGADNYQCAATLLYWSWNSCTAGCSTADDCCPAGTDCSAYPQRRACDGGTCKLAGCADDAECETWATGVGMPTPANWVCRSAPYTDTPSCTVACTTTDDCCPGGTCLAYPNRRACIGGYCGATCLDDAECQSWATDTGLADPGAYVCHPFTY